MDFALAADADAAAKAVQGKAQKGKPTEVPGEAIMQGAAVAAEVATEVMGGLSSVASKLGQVTGFWGRGS